MPTVEATPQDGSSKAGDGMQRRRTSRPCCSAQELGTEGMGFTTHTFADSVVLCWLRAFTAQLIRGDAAEPDLGSADPPRQAG